MQREARASPKATQQVNPLAVQRSNTATPPIAPDCVGLLQDLRPAPTTSNDRPAESSHRGVQRGAEWSTRAAATAHYVINNYELFGLLDMAHQAGVFPACTERGVADAVQLERLLEGAGRWLKAGEA